jgi:hypothetical protein
VIEEKWGQMIMKLYYFRGGVFSNRNSKTMTEDEGHMAEGWLRIEGLADEREEARSDDETCMER